MNALALLALMFGFTGMMLLDGQVFTHAMIGIVCGVIAAVCGVVLVRRGREACLFGWSFAVLGLALTIWCGIESPSAYRYQEKFNNRSREHREKMDRQNQTLNHAPQPTPGSGFSSTARFTSTGSAWLSLGR